MKRSTIITIAAFALGIILLTALFIVLTDNNLFPKEDPSTTTTTTTPSTTTTTTTGTSSTDPEYEPMDFASVDVSQYVTLGNYKGLKIAVDSISPDDDDISLYIGKELFKKNKFTKLESGTVAEHAIFNFDYSGWFWSVDAETGKQFKYSFDGGTASGSNAYIIGDTFYIVGSSGSDSTFIDGFAKGILGAEVGKEFDIVATFPEVYASKPELAGKSVYFTVKVNYIAQPDTSDENISSLTSESCKTLAEYTEVVRDALTYTTDQNNIAKIWTAVRDAATITELPKQEVDYWYNAFKDEVEYYVYYYSMMGQTYTYESMLKMFGFEDDAALKEYAESIVKDELITYAVIQAEGIELTDAEYEHYLDLKVRYGSETRDEILKNYTEDQLREEFLIDKAGDLLLSENTLTKK